MKEYIVFTTENMCMSQTPSGISDFYSWWLSQYTGNNKQELAAILDSIAYNLTYLSKTNKDFLKGGSFVVAKLRVEHDEFYTLNLENDKGIVLFQGSIYKEVTQSILGLSNCYVHEVFSVLSKVLKNIEARQEQERQIC